MKASIIAVGTELLFGQTVNTNASYLSENLNHMGFDVMYHFVVGDNPERLKEKLAEAYRMTDEARMAEKIIDIMDICEATGNSHLLWFRKLLDEHFSGIIAHATYRISAGKIEGINQKIKTLRRHGYGYPDDEYFFLKLLDMSRQGYVRNVLSHRFCD